MMKRNVNFEQGYCPKIRPFLLLFLTEMCLFFNLDIDARNNKKNTSKKYLKKHLNSVSDRLI